MTTESGECCPGCRHAQAVSLAWFEARTRYLEETCPNPRGCDDVLCDRLPESAIVRGAACEKGRCVGLTRPWPDAFACERDSDCTLTALSPQCCPGCEKVHAVHVDWVKAVGRLPPDVCADGCGGEPGACPAPRPPPPTRAVCTERQCTGAR